MKEITLTKAEARTIALASQYHFNENNLDDGPESTYEVIDHIGYVQIDTISVVERAHHHTLWNRHHSYTPGDLDTLQIDQRRVFEYWSHAASYLPMHHYRFCLPRMRRIRDNGINWFPKDKRMIGYVLDRIKNEGPLQAKDFKAPQHQSGPWWGWKPAKIALEYLFMEGAVLVVNRKGFQKVYDLAERIVPAETNTRMPTPTEMAEFLIDNALRSQGLISVKDITYLRKDGIEKVQTVLQRKLKKKEITAVRVEGVGDLYYAAPGLPSILDTQTRPFLRFLSPFDNFVIRRQRVAELFDFFYQVECYVPAAKRKRGYFSLPILYKDHFVGTMDAKAHRKTGIFAVKHLYLDHMPQSAKDKDDFSECFHRELRAFMVFNGCTDLEVECTRPRGLEF
ncbi:MAG: winged helix-turn-helix domain-containing protein [bacterium]|nr:winged helix-turn-helix domain-containing protein [bacterium]